MAIKPTIEEAELLISASRDLLEKGKTDKICPRCGNKITEIRDGHSGTIKCETPDCLSMDFRGL